MDKAHKKLRVWQEAMTLVKLVYEATAVLPPTERYGLTSQMRRAAVSVPSNIAEGAARSAKKESIWFYTISRASLSELDTQIELCHLIGFFDPSHDIRLLVQVDTVDSLLSGLIRFLRNK
jgi:four helix bundle protein